jgi:putative YhbY family RNA-binding protein
MPTLDPSARRALRARAHHLHPVVSIGQNGLTPAVLHEIDVALTAHELIKVRVFGDDREARETLLDEICTALDATPVQTIGKLLVVYRASPDKPKPAAARKPKTRNATAGATGGMHATTATRRRRTQGTKRPVAPSGVPRAGLPRRRRTRA